MKIINSSNKNIKKEFQKDSSINEVMAIEEGFWDDDFISKTLTKDVIKCPKLCDVIYGRPSKDKTRNKNRKLNIRTSIFPL